MNSDNKKNCKAQNELLTRHKPILILFIMVVVSSEALGLVSRCRIPVAAVAQRGLFRILLGSGVSIMDSEDKYNRITNAMQGSTISMSYDTMTYDPPSYNSFDRIWSEPIFTVLPLPFVRYSCRLESRHAEPLKRTYRSWRKSVPLPSLLRRRPNVGCSAYCLDPVMQ